MISQKLDNNSALENLLKQRESGQIREWEYEERLEQLEGQAPKTVPFYINLLIIAAIGAVVLLASFVLYPAETVIFLGWVESFLTGLVMSLYHDSIFLIPERAQEFKESTDAIADQMFSHPVLPE